MPSAHHQNKSRWGGSLADGFLIEVADYFGRGELSGQHLYTIEL